MAVQVTFVGRCFGLTISRRGVLSLTSQEPSFRKFNASVSHRLVRPLTSILGSRNVTGIASTTPSSIGSGAYFKWFLAAFLGVGSFLYFKKSRLLKSSCKEMDSTRNRYNFIAEAVEKASPSVVHIVVSKQVNTIFGHYLGKATGSGFVVENGEYVLTNAHVVSGAGKVEVKLSSGLVVQGIVTDLDEEVDLALVKMELPSRVTVSPAVFVKAGSIRPGEWVVALGSPFTLSNTITCGVVSTVGRPSKDLGLDKGDMDYIQTDAAITIGNSGGPLVNLDGEVIGINVMTAHPGISFAIPAQRAEAFLRSASKKSVGRISKAYWIGASMVMLSGQPLSLMQYYYSIPRDVDRGILLASVQKNSAADKAGLRRGDVLVEINGEEVSSLRDIVSVITQGKRFSVMFLRQGERMVTYVLPENS